MIYLLLYHMSFVLYHFSFSRNTHVSYADVLAPFSLGRLPCIPFGSCIVHILSSSSNRSLHWIITLGDRFVYIAKAI